jgi:uncharacterized coiled-coil DUF342 family protein
VITYLAFGVPAGNRQYIISTPNYLNFNSNALNAVWRYPMTQPNEHLIAVIEKDLEFAQAWFDHVQEGEPIAQDEIDTVLDVCGHLRALLEENKRLKEEMNERETIVKTKLKIKQEAVDEVMTEIQQTREELERTHNKYDQILSGRNHYEQRAEAYWGKIGLLELELEQVKAERDELKELTINRMEIENGKINFAISGEAVKVFAACLLRFFEDNGGKNFFSFDAVREGMKFSVSITNLNGELSVSDKLNQLSAEAESLRTELSALKRIAQTALDGSLDDAHEALTKISQYKGEDKSGRSEAKEISRGPAEGTEEGEFHTQERTRSDG